ncbi:MAG: hypothetical protein ACE144_10900 [Thermodesulfobacteriota bacterium]
MKSRYVRFAVLPFILINLLLVAQGKAEPLFPSVGGSEPKPGTHAPIITHAFAVDKGYFGYIWKIYIEAEDPDGDMLRIASVADQVGFGGYPTDWIYLRGQNQKRFRGYIQWNTYSSKAGYLPEWTRITLKVSVFDKAGNESNVVVFPFTFETGVINAYNYKVPPPFDQGDLPRLGYIAIDLRNPTGDGDNRRIND